MHGVRSRHLFEPAQNPVATVAPVAAGCGRLRAVASGCKRLRPVASGCKRLQMPPARDLGFECLMCDDSTPQLSALTADGGPCQSCTPSSLRAAIGSPHSGQGFPSAVSASVRCSLERVVADSTRCSDGRFCAPEVLHCDGGAPRTRRTDSPSRRSNPPSPARVSRPVGAPAATGLQTAAGALAAAVSACSIRGY